jgi:hypothetical protein
MDAISDSKDLIDRFVSEAKDDDIGLWEIVREVEQRTGPGAALMQETLAVVRELLSRGLRAGDPPYAAGGYRPWPNQQPDSVTRRIRSKWQALGREPSIADIAWFRLRG